MKLFERVRGMFGRPTLDAATALPPPQPPKVRPGFLSAPSFLKTTKTTDAALPETDRRLATTNQLTYRNGANTKAVMRDLIAASPDLSAAVWSYARLGIPKKYTVIAKNLDGTFNPEATGLAHQIITRFDLLPDYTVDGFTGQQSIRSCSESLGRDIMTNGAMCGELVLDKARMPKRVQIISSTQIKFIADKDLSLRPVQEIGSEKIDLDVPTFVYVALDQDLLEPSSTPPMEAAIKPTITAEDFANDIHRIIKRVVHPRNTVKIDEEKVRKYLSLEAQNDAAKANEELAAIVSQVESMINGLQPEDALVYLDSLDFVVIGADNSGLSSEYSVLQDIFDGRLASGSKTLGSVLGHSKASSNIASSEVLLFQKSVTGAVTLKLNEFWSRMLTIAVRVMGVDAVVHFEFADIDLRPEADLAAFRQTEQMMILEKLSYGFITDEEASIALTGKLPPAGFKPLAGTRFKDAKPAGAGTQEPSNSGSTLNQNLNGDAPSTARGQNKKADGNKVFSLN